MDELKITLKAARVNADMTQKEVAERLEISEQTYINWEKKPSRIRAYRQQELSVLFGIPIDNVLFLP